MKKLLIIGLFLLFTACATCPKYDVVILANSPFGPIVMGTEKGTYTEKYHSLEQFLNGEGWITLEEFNAWRAARGSI